MDLVGAPRGPEKSPKLDARASQLLPSYISCLSRSCSSDLLAGLLLYNTRLTMAQTVE